jgi:hypothetical protein
MPWTAVLRVVSGERSSWLTVGGEAGVSLDLGVERLHHLVERGGQLAQLLVPAPIEPPAAFAVGDGPGGAADVDHRVQQANEDEPSEGQAAQQRRQGGDDEGQPHRAQRLGQLVEGEHLEVAVPCPERDPDGQLRPAGLEVQIAFPSPVQHGVAHRGRDQLLVLSRPGREPASAPIEERNGVRRSLQRTEQLGDRVGLGPAQVVHQPGVGRRQPGDVGQALAEEVAAGDAVRHQRHDADQQHAPDGEGGQHLHPQAPGPSPPGFHGATR